MSNTTKNLKKRLKAPRELIYAAKTGERVTPRRKTDTNATHIRRFSKALAVYACAALVLIGGSLTLPALLSNPAPTPTSQPNGPAAQTSAAAQAPAKPAAADGYVSLSEEEAANYIRPDLIWANELNSELKDTVIWTAENVGGETSVLSALTLPDVGGEGAEYAVELRMEIIDNEAAHATLAWMKRHMSLVKTELEEMDFEAVDILPADRSAPTSCFAASRAELGALDSEALLSILSAADGDLRFKLQIAWQSLDGSQTPMGSESDNEVGTYRENYFVTTPMDLSEYALDKYVYAENEGFVRPDLIWANEDNVGCAYPFFSATRMMGETTVYPLSNETNITGYNFAVDIRIVINLDANNLSDEQYVKADESSAEYVNESDEAKIVEKALGWEKIAGKNSYVASCEQLSALDESVLDAFADAYGELYGIDGDTIPSISILFDTAWQSIE